MIVGTGTHVLADPVVTPAGNLQLAVGARRRGLANRDLGWERIATIVLTPEQELELWRVMREARIEALQMADVP